MVVLVVNQYGVLAFEPEGQPPVAADPYRPMPLQVSLQRVQPPVRGTHIRRLPCLIERRKLKSQSGRVRRLNPRVDTSLEETPQAFVAETLDHGSPYTDTAQYT